MLLGIPCCMLSYKYENYDGWHKGVAGIIIGLIGFLMTVIGTIVFNEELAPILLGPAVFHLGIMAAATYVLIIRIRKIDIRAQPKKRRLKTSRQGCALTKNSLKET